MLISDEGKVDPIHKGVRVIRVYGKLKMSKIHNLHSNGNIEDVIGWLTVHRQGIH